MVDYQYYDILIYKGNTMLNYQKRLEQIFDLLWKNYGPLEREKKL